MVDQKDWHLIHELYKNKNITKTAEKLFVSQPSISYRLKRIEQDLGVSLFFKTKKRGLDLHQKAIIWHSKHVK